MGGDLGWVAYGDMSSLPEDVEGEGLAWAHQLTEAEEVMAEVLAVADDVRDIAAVGDRLRQLERSRLGGFLLTTSLRFDSPTSRGGRPTRMSTCIGYPTT